MKKQKAKPSAKKSAKSVDDTTSKQLNSGERLIAKGYGFKPGQSGNPAGRPKGSRSKFAETFVKDMLADWEEHGAEAIQKVRETDPASYLRVAATLIPKDFNINVVDDSVLDKMLDNLNDEELNNLITGLAAVGASKQGKEKAAEAEPRRVTDRVH